MITWKQIERQWQAGDYGKLLGELTTGRPEASPRMQLSLGRALPAAAMAVIRMDELSQNYLTIFAKMTRTVLVAQDSDGGWGDVMTTALCLRSLLVSNGHGVAVEQESDTWRTCKRTKASGRRFRYAGWNRMHIRRRLSCSTLGMSEMFRSNIDFDAAVAWFKQHASELDGDTHKLWQRAMLKCQGASNAFVLVVRGNRVTFSAWTHARRS